MSSWVELAVDGRRARIEAGGIVGRMATASLRLDDSRVSEAHALVSRRGRQLKLLALRRWFEVDGERSSEVALAQGQTIRLAPGVRLKVTGVHLADEVLAVCLAGRCTELEGSVYSVVRDAGRTRIEVGYVDAARAHLWSTAAGWSARIGHGEAFALAPGQSHTIEGETLTVVALRGDRPQSTVGPAGLDAALRIVLRHDTVHLFRPSRPPVVLTGMSARIVSEVALLAAPAPWHVPAGEIWRSGPRHTVRQNWDRNNRTLRRKLKEADVRPDLVRADGHGNVELFLLSGDEVVDET